MVTACVRPSSTRAISPNGNLAVVRAVAALVVMGCGRASFAPITDAGVSTGDGGVPPNVNIMFTTAAVQPPGTLGGLAGADSLCRTSAAGAGLPGTYVAFLSDSTTSARARLGGARGWMRPDGRPFVDDIDSLLLGHVSYPPVIDEYGDDVGFAVTYVATGTSGAGAYSGLACSDWSSTAGSVTHGYTVSGDIQVVTTGSTGALTCDTPMHIYCFGVDHATPITPPPVTGKRAFIANGFMPNSGISAGDMLCASDAGTAGLIGSFRALLATATAAAASRFAIGPRYRVDGVLFTADFSAIDAPLRTYVDGRYSTNLIWTGASSGFMVGTSQTTCMSWTASGGNGTVGSNEYATSTTFNKLQYSCSSALAIYCIEE